MGRVFDPYHKWLGIPPEEQPANHYRLLGLRAFETDPDVIQAAADQRMAHLRNYQTGQHADLSQRLLNEVAAARVCLLNPGKRAAYDAKLREKIEATQAEAQEVQAAPSGGLLTGMLEELADYPTASVRKQSLPILSYRQRRLLRKVGAGLIVVIFLWWLVNNFGGSGGPPATPEPAPMPPRAVAQNVKKTKRPDDTATANSKRPDSASEKTAKDPVRPAPSPSTPPSPVAKDAEPPPAAPKKTSQAILKLAPDVPPPLGDPAALASVTHGKIGDGEQGSDARVPSLLEKPRRERVAVPDAAALESAMKLARDLYNDEFMRAKSPREKTGVGA